MKKLLAFLLLPILAFATAGDVKVPYKSSNNISWIDSIFLPTADQTLGFNSSLVPVGLKTGFNVRSYGATGDGTTDDTAAVQAAISAATGSTLYFPPGTYIVSELTGVNNITLRGAGMGVSTIKRKASSALGLMFEINAKHNFRVFDLTFDGNKANQSNGGHNVYLTACYDWTFERVEFINAKTPYGDGLQVAAGANGTNSYRGIVTGCRFTSNDVDGCYINKDYYVLVERSFFKSNTSHGLVVQNLVYPPVEGVTNFLTIDKNEFVSNGTGCAVVGYYTGGTSNAPYYGNGTPASKWLQMTSNTARGSTTYGFVFQGHGGVITGNTAYQNGSAVAGAGFLMNAYGTEFIGNTAEDNGCYGLDAGGAANCRVIGNFFLYQGSTLASTSTDMNFGAGNNNTIAHNNIVRSASALAGTAISVSGIEGSGTGAVFPVVTTQTTIDTNTINLSGSVNDIGIWVHRNADRTILVNNIISGATADNRAFILEVLNLTASGNIDTRWYASGTQVPIIASATTLVIPDVGNQFFVSGTTNIDSIRSFSQNVFYQKVRDVTMTNNGTGYTAGTPFAVTFSGGGGASATSTASVTNSGTVMGVSMTNNGSGYTSVPTVSFAAGAGSAAAGTALVGCNNCDGRTITIMFTGILTVNDSTGNLELASNLTTAANKTILVLRGAYGNWYEVSRSSL